MKWLNLLRWVLPVIKFFVKIFSKRKKKKISMYDKYKFELGLIESSNNYMAVNNVTGALGKYQFMPGTLNNLKFLYSLPDWDNANYFLSSPDLQEKYEDALIKDSLAGIQRKNLTRFVGETVTGDMRFNGLTSTINIYGLLAAIHLAGQNKVESYFINGTNYNDGHASIKDYLAYMSSKVKGGSLNLAGFGNVGVVLPVAIIAYLVLYYK